MARVLDDFLWKGSGAALGVIDRKQCADEQKEAHDRQAGAGVEQ